jgi:excisionase family DNA binding protein
MSVVREFLARRGLEIDDDELVAALEELLGEHAQPGDASMLGEAEEALLQGPGRVPRPDHRSTARAMAHTAARATTMAAASITTAEMAERLGVHPSRVRHQLSDGQLFAVRTGRQNRFPTWQLVDGTRPLPGLRAVLAALPKDLHPLEVEGFVTTPAPELELDGRPASPAEWLAGGGAVDVVVALAAGVALV